MIHRTRSRIPLTSGLITLCMLLPASSDVIYSNLLDTAIPTNFDGVTITVNGGTINPFFGGVGVANSAELQPLRDGTGGLDTILNLSFGATIDGSSQFLSSGSGGSQDHLGSNFTAGQEGYIGFQLNGTDYGWMRVIFTNNTGGAMVKDWAYDNSGSAITVGGIRQAGQDILLSSGFTVGSALNDSGGATNLVKNSTGTNTLTATNTYSGTTTVSSGTLAVGGTGSINNSAVTIDGGTFRYNSSVAYSGTLNFTSGTLGGSNLTGGLGGQVIGAGQAISPGNSPGMAVTTSQVWAAGGTYVWEINDVLGGTGSDPGWDLLNGTGNLNITASAGSEFNIAITSLGLNNVEGSAANFSDLASYNWLIADFDTVTSFAANAFAIDTSGFANVFTGSFGIARGDSILGGNASQIYLTYTPVPEPRGLMFLGVALLLLSRRRRP